MPLTQSLPSHPSTVQDIVIAVEAEAWDLKPDSLHPAMPVLLIPEAPVSFATIFPVHYQVDGP